MTSLESILPEHPLPSNKYSTILLVCYQGFWLSSFNGGEERRRGRGQEKKGGTESTHSPCVKILLVEHNSLFNNYSTIFTEPEEKKKGFSIMSQVIIRETAFCFLLFVSYSETSRNRAAILNISDSVL